MGGTNGSIIGTGKIKQPMFCLNKEDPHVPICTREVIGKRTFGLNNNETLSNGAMSPVHQIWGTKSGQLKFLLFDSRKAE